MALRAASAATHPFAVWQDIVISEGQRYQELYGSMRELARREPTFAMHVHVAIPDPDQAVEVANRMRAHLPLLLALSANSPYWQGRDTGMASARIPIFQAFPRSGMPRAFAGYRDYVQTLETLIGAGAFPEPNFVWWDLRLQPKFGTVEIRIMDAQTDADRNAPLAALVQALARLEALAGYAPAALVEAPEVLEENRFLAARDGAAASLIDPSREARVPVRELIEPSRGCRVPIADLLRHVVDAARPHAQDLGCEAELEGVERLLARPSAQRQLEIARLPERLPGLVHALAETFTA